ncbi:MAG: DUF2782 domain-containing protein [Amphritea sp.]|nr:DUF2782 domain-containing protein [Amphritea sp.]
MKKFLILAALLTVFTQMPAAVAEPAPEFDENEPVVTIRQGKKATYYEYRVNGILKEIKVEPVVGKTYYLVPTDDGEFARFDDSTLMLPKWIIFSW